MAIVGGRGWKGLTGLCFAALFVLAAGPAPAELVHGTEYREHRVSGATPREIWQYMNAHPIIDPDDGPAYANLTHEHDLNLTTATAGGTCRVTGLTFRWRFVLTLPKAVDYAGMSAGTQSLWSAFVAGLKRHEETHRTIFLGCGAKFVPAAEKLTGPAGCLGIERKVKRFIDQKYEECMAEQSAFEERDRARILGLAFIKAARGN
jgi:predicted secreted Zn-dependent protease